MANAYNVQQKILFKLFERFLCPECKGRLSAQFNSDRNGSALSEAISNDAVKTFNSLNNK